MLQEAKDYEGVKKYCLEFADNQKRTDESFKHNVVGKDSRVISRVKYASMICVLKWRSCA